MLDKRKKGKIENSTTASKIATQASAKERRGHKQAQESKQGRIEELRQQASEKESLKGTEARSFTHVASTRAKTTTHVYF